MAGNEEIGQMLEKAEKKADQAEIYKGAGRQILLKSILDRIESCDSSFSEGYAVRVIKNGRLGFSFFSSQRDFPKALDSALQSSKFSLKTDISFPAKQRYKKVKGLCEFSVGDRSEEEASSDLISMMDAVKKTKATPVQNFVNMAEEQAVLVNSEGGEFTKNDSMMTASSIAKFRESVQGEFKVSRAHFDAAKLAESAGTLARKLAAAKPIHGEFDILLHPKALLQLFEVLLMPSLDGRRAFQGMSYFSGKLGKGVASPAISLVDRPLMDYGIESAVCDDECTPCKDKALIGDGVLKSFLFDIESAAIAKSRTTGNGFRHGFTISPGTSCSNIVVEGKPAMRMDEFDGVVIYELIAEHNANTLTGEFALQIGAGAVVKRGEIKKPIRACSVVGNFFQILEQAELAGETLNYSWLYSPSLKYRGKIV